MKVKPISTVCAAEKREWMVSYIYITPFILKDPKALCKPRVEVTSAFAEIGTTGVKHAKSLNIRNQHCCTAAREKTQDR